MDINVSFDPSVSSAPSGFVAAVDYVVALFDATFTNNVTINIDVGWGEVDGQALDKGALGESETNGTNGFTFAQVKAAAAALAGQGDPVPLNGLPATDPTGGGVVDPSSAVAKALGLIPQDDQIDGWIGLASTPNTFDFNPADRAVPGLFDAIGVIEHELTEAMGRIAGLSPGPYTLQDLYRYSAPGAIDLTGNQRDYFSVNGGVTDIDNYNTDPKGDPGDWAQSAGADAFLAFSSAGIVNTLTTADILQMAALGWVDTPVPTVAHDFIALPAGGVAKGATVAIALDFNTYVTVTGAPTVTLSNGGVATYASGSGGHTLVFDYTAPGALTSIAGLSPTEINLNGGAIDSSVGNAATLSIGVTPAQYQGVVVGGGGAALSGSNDVFLLSNADNSVTGHGGVNTAVLTGLLAQYTVTDTNGAITVIDGLGDRDGTTTLSGVQQVAFSDTTLVFDLQSSQDLLVYELYQASFARIPDNAGFRFWAGVADSTNASAISLADDFIASPEFTQKFGVNPNNTQFVTELYQNVLQRAPDPGGLAFWVNAANNGEGHDQLLVAFAISPENVQLIGPHISDGYWTT
jgi:hypothetical protein